MTSAPAVSSLTGLFREFYATVTRLHDRIEQGAVGRTEAGLEAVQAPLLAVLGDLDADAADSYGTDPLALEQARYALAAFADDYFSRLSWAGSESWRSASLESQLFHSDDAGFEIFRRIDRLLAVGDPGRQDLARLYLMALSLGFRGDLSDAAADRTLRKYRQGLLAFATGGPESTGDDHRISPTAYRHTLAGAPRILLPNVRFWRWLAAGSVLLLLLISYWSWADLTTPVAAAVERILERSVAP